MNASMRAAARAVVPLVASLLCAACGDQPTGPIEPAWDRDVCAHCSMHISEPAFAVQELVEGRRQYFDDPGCWVLHGGPQRPGPTWFRHLHEARWLSRTEVAFVPVDHSPMGFAHGAVDAGTPGALSMGAFAERVRGDRR